MADTIHQKELTAELAAARSQMSGYVTALRQDLNVGARVKRGVAQNPAVWFGGAVVLGLLLSRISPGSRKVVVKSPAVHKKGAQDAGRAAFVLGALKFGLDFAKPALVAWVKSRLFKATPPKYSHHR